MKRLKDILFKKKFTNQNKQRSDMRLKVNVIQGDLFEEILSGKYNFTAHGCNCFHTMGSGIAPLMNYHFDGELLDIDKETVYGDINKLGSVNYIDFGNIVAFNMYTQHGTGSDGVYVHWDSVRSAFSWIYSLMYLKKQTPKGVIPLIGCGLAGGEIGDFVKTISDVYDDNNVHGELTIVVMTEEERKEVQYHLKKEGLNPW